ncbi:MAG: hypothetical protein ACRC6E_02640, partial [Fusobacteriaceae bacterium]
MGDIFKMENRNPLQELNTTNERATPVVQNITGGIFEGGMKVLNHMVDTKAKEAIDGKNKLYQEALQEEKRLKAEYTTLQKVDLSLKMSDMYKNYTDYREEDTFNDYEEAEKNIKKISEGMREIVGNTFLEDSDKALAYAQIKAKQDDVLKVEKINSVNYQKKVYTTKLEDQIYASEQSAYEASNSGDQVMMKKSAKNIEDLYLSAQKLYPNVYTNKYIGTKMEEVNKAIITGQMNNDKIQLGVEMEKQLAEGKSVESYAVELKGYYDGVIDKYSGSEGLKNFEKDYGIMSVENRDIMLKYIEGEANENKKTLQRIYTERYGTKKKEKENEVILAMTNGSAIQNAYNTANITGSEDRVVATMGTGTLMLHVLNNDPRTRGIATNFKTNNDAYNSEEAVDALIEKHSEITDTKIIAFSKVMVNRENSEFNAQDSYETVKTGLYQNGNINRDMPLRLRKSILLTTLKAGGMTSAEIKSVGNFDDDIGFNSENNIKTKHLIGAVF